MPEQHTKGLDKATPGPWMWFTEHKGDSDKPHVKFLKSKVNNQGFAHTVGLSEPQDTANADLIAAAPTTAQQRDEFRRLLIKCYQYMTGMKPGPDAATLTKELQDTMDKIGITGTAKARPDES